MRPGLDRRQSLVALGALGLLAVWTIGLVPLLNPRIEFVSAVRTFVFWAMVCAPVAALVGVLAESVRSYRAVRVVVDESKHRVRR